jgi:hypothetical protein
MINLLELEKELQILEINNMTYKSMQYREVGLHIFLIMQTN